MSIAAVPLAPVVAAIVVVAYLLGSIPFGLLVAMSQGVDIRKVGSGNIGATNVWRVMGKKWGLITFLADAAKGLFAVMAGMWIAGSWGVTIPLAWGHTRVEHLTSDFAGIAAALGCILGHNFPIWLKFRGGKGVATSLGVVIGMMPVASLIIFAIWGIVLRLTGYVSLASIVAAVSLPVIAVFMLFAGWLKGWGLFYFSLAAALLIVKRHTANIRRLVEGTELRFGAKKDTAAESAATAETTPAAEPPKEEAP